MSTTLGDLKETKLPTYKVGVSSSNYSMLLLAAAASRSRAKDVFTGVILNEITNHHDATSSVNLSNDQLNNVKKENARAFNDLMNCMPTTGNWLQIIKDSTSTHFPEGCGRTAYERLMAEIAEEVDGDRDELKDEFESQEKIGYNVSPKDHINHLKLLKDKLDQHHGIKKTDRDILDQMFKVLKSKYDPEVATLKADLVRGKTVTLTEAGKVFNMKYKQIKRKTKSKNDDGSSKHGEERGLAADFCQKVDVNSQNNSIGSPGMMYMYPPWHYGGAAQYVPVHLQQQNPYNGLT